MSDDASASPAAALPPLLQPPAADSSSISHLPAAGDDANPRVRMREHDFAQRSKKVEYLVDILRSLDILIYAELSVLYYMEYIPSCLICPHSV